jgi:RND superfamily putative drug exporter
MEGPSYSVAARGSRLGRLAHFTARYRWPVIAAWIVLTLVGGVAAGKLSTRWYQSLSIPGKPAYEGSQRALEALGVGVRPPSVVVFHSSRVDVTKSPAVRAAMARVAKARPGALTSSYFSTGNLMYASRDRHTTFLEVYPPGPNRLDVKSGAAKLRAVAATGLPAGITVDVTGHDPLEEASTDGSSGGSSVLLEALIGGLGALIILLFVFGTLPAVLMPLVVAVAAIPQYVHARLGADLHHRRLDHRAVPDRAGRPRRRDRLRAADGLPLPR